MNQPNPPRALLLDLDGTISDTLPHIFDAYRHAVAPWVERPPTDAEVEATFGPAERECIARMVPGASLDEAERRFHEFYEAEPTTSPSYGAWRRSPRLTAGRPPKSPWPGCY